MCASCVCVPCPVAGPDDPGDDPDHPIVPLATADPIFNFLKSQKGGLLNNDVKWNFAYA